MSHASASICDQVLAFIQAHIAEHSCPPTLAVMACDLGLHRSTVSEATARLVWQGRLPLHHRSAAAFAEHRNAELRAMSEAGTSKAAIARLASISVRQIHRIIPLTTAG